MPTATGARPASRIQLLTPLRHRDFRLLWTGMSISLLGDGILLVALAWQTYSLSNTPAAMSAVGIGSRSTVAVVTCVVTRSRTK